MLTNDQLATILVLLSTFFAINFKTISSKESTFIEK